MNRLNSPCRSQRDPLRGHARPTKSNSDERPFDTAQGKQADALDRGIGSDDRRERRNNRLWMIVVGLFALVAAPMTAGAMHISEGILPASRAAFWFVVAAPLVAWGLHVIRFRRRKDPRYLALLSLVGAGVFVVSCMPIPIPVAGSCSHPCGTGLAAILVGPAPTVVIASIALLFQALFLAHGGLTTLGANIVTMGILGGFTGWGAFQIARRLGAPILVAAFLCGLLSDWATYAGTSFILAESLHQNGSLWGMFGKIALAFVPTQLPLGIVEGIVTAGAYRFVLSRRPEMLEPLVAVAGSGRQ